ncbi:MAG TPA: glutamate--tRNA ligase [Myxococcota bacterium]|nr:glutamate--tRNA ligase [Myxococcota bacterium]
MVAGPVTRFAPSPTGHLHIGGARTALYNWALARKGGRFLLRIEDTDQARSSDQAARGILEDLAWLGIAWDEGPAFEGLGGDPRGVGPWRQTERLPHYAAAVDALIARDLAYPAFDTPEQLEALRAAARSEKRNFRYRRAADFDRAAALARMAREEHVVRFRMPDEPVHVVDRVLGAIRFGEEHLDDFVIRKRDGFPTYHLAVVVDDELMRVTHVLRGQEHLNNTPRHVALQRALGYREPVYAHLPVIFNADGSKMSKRDKDKAAREAVKAALAADADARDVLAGIVPADRLDPWLRDKRAQLAPSDLAPLADALALDLPCIEVEDFRRAGYLPEALCNYLALLGWSPGEKDEQGRDRERFDRAYLAERFSLERIGAANARFDRDKLLAFNQDAIAALSDGGFFARWDAWCERYAPHARARDEGWRRRYAAMVRTRCRTLADATAPGGPGAFAWADDGGFAYDPAAVEQWLRKGDPSGLARLREAEVALAELDPFDPDAIEAAVTALAARLGVGMGKLAQPLRVAVTGRAASPPLGETLAILGRDAVLRRIARCRTLE